MTNFFDIAGHAISVENRNGYRISPLLVSMSPFWVNEPANSLICAVVLDDTFARRDIECEVGVFDNVDCDYGVYKLLGGGYQIDMTQKDGQRCMTLQADSSFSHVLVSLSDTKPHLRGYALNNAMMLAYAFASADKDTLLMHSSVVMKAGRAYMFLGRSGTGKSTHTRLWRENIPCCSILNDDNPVLRYVDGRTMVYGSPWSGKNPVYRKIGAEVGGIVQLRQAPFNRIERLGIVEAMAVLLPSASNMRWDRRVNSGLIDSVSNILTATPVYQMDCLPDADAAWTSYRMMTQS